MRPLRSVRSAIGQPGPYTLSPAVFDHDEQLLQQQQRTTAQISKTPLSHGNATYTSVCFPPLPVVQHHPVIHLVILVPVVLHGCSEEFAEEVVVGCFIECQFADVIEVDGKFLCGRLVFAIFPLGELTRIVLNEILDSGCLLLLPDLFILLLVRSCLEALPRQTTAQEVEENMS